jgi:protein-L-isoaspartate(D-aspartate) O-methyltransferase
MKPRRRPSRRPWIALLPALGLALAQAAAADGFAALRAGMVAEIESDVAATSLYIDKQALDPRVMETMGRVPRHQFVPERQRPYAYENRPLAIGHGQTISQPYIVALMSDLVRPEPGSRVLEIGTGSGYQAAVLAELASEVYSIEIVPELAAEADARLRRLGYPNLHTREGDGYYGWEAAAPFDAIVVTAAASHVPPPLVEQLKPGGRMVIPVGGRFQVQQLMLVEKQADGSVQSRQVLPVRFVPLTGEH